MSLLFDAMSNVNRSIAQLLLKRPALLVLLISIIYLTYVVYRTFPKFQVAEDLPEVQNFVSSSEYRDFLARVTKNTKEHIDTTGTTTFSINEFIDGRVKVYATIFDYDTTSTVRFTHVETTTHLKLDKLILTFGSLVAFLFVFWFLGINPNRMYSVSKIRFSKEKGSKFLGNASTAEQLLSEDVLDAARRSADLYTRSTVLLAGGIIMAFVGVTIFYFSLPQAVAEERVESYLSKSIRPTGMLIFVESIAWFLLRQYRALIEDYKGFHRIYLKRSNYLLALKIFSNESVSAAQLYWAATLIQEDLTGKLKSGESTETIEAVKTIEPNPIFELLKSAIDALPKPKKS